jgi:ankyrin
MLTRLAHDSMTGVTELPNILPVATQLLPLMHDLGALRVDGLPLVSWAVFAGSEPLAKLLVEAGASLDATDEAGQTPLIHAARIGAVSMTKWLQNAGADSEHRDHSGLKAVDWAKKVAQTPSSSVSGDSDTSRLERPKSPPNDIFAAVAENRLKELPQLLLDSPTAIHSSRGGLQPIHLAAALGHDEDLNLLLANGASLSDAASDSSTPLTIAAQFDHQGLIKKLAPNLSPEELRVTMEQLRSCWKEWAHAGALNAMLNLGWKAENPSDALLAVQHAVKEGDLPLLQRLLVLKASLKPTAERPGNVHDRSESRANLLELTLRHGDTRMLAFLLQNVPLKQPDWQHDLISTLHEASRTGNLFAVKLMLETTPLDPNARLRPSPKADAFSNDGVRVRITALCQALCYQQNEIVHYLLTHGARVEGTDYLSNAPLAAAVSGGDISLVELMLKHHAVVNETNDRGETALHIAAGAGHVEIARLLIRHGADPDIEDKEGRTPAEIAKVYGRPAW